MEEKKIVIEVTYLAIKMDNYQGGSGMPFKQSIYMHFHHSVTIGTIYKQIQEKLDKFSKLKVDFSEAYSIYEIKICRKIDE